MTQKWREDLDDAECSTGCLWSTLLYTMQVLEWYSIAKSFTTQRHSGLGTCAAIDEPIRVDHTILEHCTIPQDEGTLVIIMLIGQTHSFTQLQEQRYCKHSDQAACALLRVVLSEGKASRNSLKEL